MRLQTLKRGVAAFLVVGAGGIALATLAVDSNAEPGRRDNPPSAATPRPEPRMEPTSSLEEDRKPVPIAGRVLDPVGKPLPGATIYVQHNRRYNVIDEVTPIEPVTTAGAGDCSPISTGDKAFSMA